MKTRLLLFIFIISGHSVLGQYTPKMPNHPDSMPMGRFVQVPNPVFVKKNALGEVYRLPQDNMPLLKPFFDETRRMPGTESWHPNDFDPGMRNSMIPSRPCLPGNLHAEIQDESKKVNEELSNDFFPRPGKRK